MEDVVTPQLDLDFNAPVPEISPRKVFGNTVSKPIEAKDREETLEKFLFEPKTDELVADYSDYPPNRMYTADEKTVLESERPPYVPLLDLKYVARNYHIPPVYKTGEHYMILSGGDSPKYYKVSIDGLAVTVDYYLKYAKAINKKETKEKLEALREKAVLYFRDNDKNESNDKYNYRFYKSVLDNTYTIKTKPIRFISKGYITVEQKIFFEENSIGKYEIWKAWRELREALEQKLRDMSCQRGDLESTYTKGAQTSYGDSNTNTTLHNDLGILVKRQNGDAITHDEINEIKEAFSAIKPVFGNLKKTCEEYGLKVSHSGHKNMHARAAVGLFYDSFKAIGVQFGNVEINHLILSHELSHFLDSWVGRDNNHFFSSDMPGSLENKIAQTFRGEMNKNNVATVNSKYLNRTCECFARAMEQYTACMVSPAQYLNFTEQEAYVRDGKFQSSILPLIDTLLIERYEKWHGKESPIENRAGTIESFMEKIRSETLGAVDTTKLKAMPDDYFIKIARHSCFLVQWHTDKIERYKNEKELPRDIHELLFNYREARQFNTSVREEFTERRDEKFFSFFPVFPLDNTAPKFKDNFRSLMKLSEYSADPLETARKIVANVLPYNRAKMITFLEKSGCDNGIVTQKVIDSLIDTKKPAMNDMKRDEASYGRGY